MELVHERDHAFKTKPGRARGCATCDRAKTDMAHHGTTQSVNYFLSKHITIYRRMKEAWEQRLLDLLAASGLGECDRVVVEGEMCFPTTRKPDQGNHRFLIEKALGDALVKGGYLPDDTWDRFSFGDLGYVQRPGESWTRLMLFPSAIGAGGVHVLGRMGEAA